MPMMFFFMDQCIEFIMLFKYLLYRTYEIVIVTMSILSLTVWSITSVLFVSKEVYGIPKSDEPAKNVKVNSLLYKFIKLSIYYIIKKSNKMSLIEVIIEFFIKDQQNKI